MKRPLYVAGFGSVTPAGLNAPQTIAAIRASLSPFQDVGFPDAGVTQLIARIPTHYSLRGTQNLWLVNLAARAIREALGSDDPSVAAGTAILIAPPEGFRNHPAFANVAVRDFLASVIDATGLRFHPSSRAIEGGAAASVSVIERALALMDENGAAQVLIGGVDSLINDIDLLRLGQAARLKNDENSQGLVPGEGAVFVRLTREPGREPVIAAIQGVGMAQEADSVLSERHSQGRAMQSALTAAVAGSGPSEPDIEFVISNSNGERYAAWEMLIAQPRFYRTRREQLITVYPAMSVGDVGAASGALAIMLAADSIVRGYAPGRIAMCEASSESGMRAAAVLAGMNRR